MKHTLLSTALATLLAAPAFAGALVDPEPTPEPIPAPEAAVADWSGFYAGLSYNRALGGSVEAYADSSATVPFNQADLNGDTGFGIFAGYNIQRGNLVFGGEFGLVQQENNAIGYPNSFLEDLMQIRGRAGYAVGKFLAYGTLGLAQADFDDGGSIFDLSGVTYGVGVQYLVSERIFVGGEYSIYDLEGTTPLSPTEFRLDEDIVSLRVGVQF